jgi:hypothetical protein
MRQFAICALRPRAKRQVWIVVLQHDEMIDWQTRVVAPLIEPRAIKEVTRVHVRVAFGGRDWLLALDRLATVNRAELGSSEGSVEDQRHAIIKGLDLIFTGY